MGGDRGDRPHGQKLVAATPHRRLIPGKLFCNSRMSQFLHLGTTGTLKYAWTYVKVDFQLKLEIEINNALNFTLVDRVLDYAYCSYS